MKKFLFFFLIIFIYNKALCVSFYVYSSSPKERNFYTPSGYMGDVSDINLSGDYKVLTLTNNPSLKLRYIPKGRQKWIGVYFQNPSGNWGSYKGGYDLTGAKKIVFYARGEKGGEIITSIGIGGIKGKFQDSDIFQTGPIKLSKNWEKYTFDISNKNLSYISGGFFFIIEAKDNPLGAVIYFGDIYYEGEKISALEILADKTPPELNLVVSPQEVNILNKENPFFKVNFEIFCDDNQNIDIWELNVLNNQDNTVKKFSGVGKTKQLIVWDGLDDIYKKPLPHGTYRVVLTAKDFANNFASKEEFLNINYRDTKKEISEQLTRKEVDINEDENFIRIRMKSKILFQKAKYKISSEGVEVLKGVLDFLNNYPDNKIIIEGHTDSIGSEEYNLQLSFMRANEVRKFLVKNNIDEKRIQIKACGETQPIASNDTYQGRAQNRRVEILIVK